MHSSFSPGTPRVNPFAAPDAPASAAQAPIDVIGDGADHDAASSVGDSASVQAVDDNTVSPFTGWEPSADIATKFMELVGMDSDVWEESKRLGPSTTNVVKRWTAPASGFRPIRRDPSLLAPFDKFAKENKPLYDFAMTAIGSSFASAHATSHASAWLEMILGWLPTVWTGNGWEEFVENLSSGIRDNVLFPLRDSAHCMAGISAKSITTVRSGVSKNAGEAVSAVLRTAAPSDGFFFGNPSSEVKDSMNFAMMNSWIVGSKKTPAAPQKQYEKRTATAAPRAAAPAAASASTSKDNYYSKGNYRGRSNRGKGGGRK